MPHLAKTSRILSPTETADSPTGEPPQGVKRVWMQHSDDASRMSATDYMVKDTAMEDAQKFLLLCNQDTLSFMEPIPITSRANTVLVTVGELEVE
jgi:hypothetical protein